MPSFIKKLGSCVVRMPLSEPNVERYLEEHPGFLQKYVVSHFSETDVKELYEHWYQAHGRKSSTEKERKRSRTEEESKSSKTIEHKSSIIDNTVVVPSVIKAATAPETPTREEAMDVMPAIDQKIVIAQRQFRKTISREGAPILKPYRRSFSDDLINIRSLLPTNLQLPGEPGEEPSARRRSREEWRQLNEPDLMMELVRDIAQDLDLVSLCFKILLNVGILTNGDRCSLFLIFGSGDQRFLVSKLFDVTENSQLTDMYEHKPIRIPYGKGIVGYVAESGETVNIPDAYQDERFNKAIDMQTGFRTKSILCMPVKNNQKEIVGVAQVINKKDEEGPFNKKDEKIFERYLTFCGIGITNALLFQSSVIMYKRSDSLVLLAHYIFEEQRDMNTLLRRVLKKGCEMFSSTGCRILLMEDCSVSVGNWSLEPENKAEQSKQALQLNSCFEVYTGDDVKDKESGDEYEFRNYVPKDRLADHIAKNLKTINAIPTESVEGMESMISPEMIGADREVRSLLAMPILTETRKVLGVVEILNKKGEERFDRNDESLFEAFTLFCGLGIFNVINFERLLKANNAQKVVLEILSYHASASKDEVSIVEREEIPTASSLKLQSYDFADHTLNRDETVLATIRMFVDLDLVNKFRIDYKTLIRWSITVRKNYRDVMYHNWRHGFNVAQMMFAMLTSGGMAQQFSDLEVFALLVGSLCHDIDHRGTTNQFQELSNSPLANLYSTSFMEYHHFNHFMTISQVEGNNIFKSLPEREYNNFIELTKSTILATDLAMYFKHKGKFKILVEDPSTDWSVDENKVMLRSMMITGCDLSAITKPWEVQRMVAEKIASEFFNQGDIERDKFGHTPSYMMDRSKRDELPKMQVNFIDGICLGLYECLEKANPLFRPLLDGCMSNRRHWSNLFERRTSFADITSANICLSTTSMSRVISLQNQPEEESGVEG